MPITTINDIAAALAASSKQTIRWTKNIIAPKAIGAFQSGWLSTGIPGAGVASPAYTAGSGYACSRTTVGALTYANGSVQNWLAKLFGTSQIAGTIILADRLWSCSGMGFGAATYTVTTPGTLPARSLVGQEVWMETFSALGAWTGTLTVNYLDQDGEAGAGVIPLVPSTPAIGQMVPVPLAAGDTGVTGIVSAVTSNTATSGTGLGLTVLNRIVEIELPIIGAGRTLDWASLALPKIPSDACLMLIWQANAATATIIQGRAEVIDK